MRRKGATVRTFRQSASVALADIGLQQALAGATYRFTEARRRALADLPNAESLRDQFKAIRSATLADLATHLERFEEAAQSVGSHVHWARDGSEAASIVVRIAKQHGITLAVKSKSMATEEIRLNEALEEEGITAVETDLGEWLIQQADEPPSHIIAPAIHMTKERAAELLSQASGRSLSADDIQVMTAEARRLLRAQFLNAGMGISGANVLVAETGSVILVTNEGNGRLVTTAPRVHVAVAGIEKVTPSWNEAAIWLSLLARSATGQPMSIYTSVITGPARANDPDGPEEVHIVLLDNGRSRLLGTEYEEILQCIRCGACLNTCPVYRVAGGHAYGNPYSGPVGAIVAPLLFGRQAFQGLPQASTLCGACRDVCPARIDIPRMLLALREDLKDDGALPWRERAGELAAAWLMTSRRSMDTATATGRLLQTPFEINGTLRFPLRLDPVAGRKLPALAGKSFTSMWRDGDLKPNEE